MQRKFVICVDDSTSNQQDTLTQYFQDNDSISYWHWFSDLWLITDDDKNWTNVTLRDKVKKLLPKANIMVIQMDGENTWSGFGNIKMFEWLDETWGK